MNFSDYTLVSFGDSFTFGQGLTDPHPMFDTKEANNSKAYSNIIKNQLGFKDIINLGFPGASNDGILSMMQTFYHKNRDPNHFYLISLTSPERDEIFTIRESTKLYNTFDFSYQSWKSGNREWKSKNKELNRLSGYDFEIYSKLSDNTVKEFLTYYHNNYSILLKHVHTFYGMINFLLNNNIKFCIVDVLNDAPSLNGRYDILKQIEKDGWRKYFIDNGYVDVELLEMYYEDLEKKNIKQYLNFYELIDLPEFVGTGKPNNKKCFSNIHSYVLKYGKEHLGDAKNVLLPCDHWNNSGHEIAAALISDFIRKTHD